MTTVIWKEPDLVATHPAGADPEGAMADVTPWGIGLARADAAKAIAASVTLILPSDKQETTDISVDNEGRGLLNEVPVSK